MAKSNLKIKKNVSNSNLSVVKDIPTTLSAIGSYAFTANEGTRN